MLDLGGKKTGKWRPPIVRTVSLDGSGIEEMHKAILNHREYLEVSGILEQVRRDRIRREVTDLIEYRIKTAVWDEVSGSEGFETLVEQIMSRETDPYTAARQILGSVNLDQCRML
jgi:LAO/AO transport system kinase